MLTAKAAELIEQIIAGRINELTEFLKNTPSPDISEFAAISLAQIGTKRSSDALMDMIKSTRQSDFRGLMVAALVLYSPLRENYRAELADLCDDCAINDMYSDIEQLPPCLVREPLWKVIAEAVDDQHMRDRYALSRAIEQDKMVLLED